MLPAAGMTATLPAPLVGIACAGFTVGSTARPGCVVAPEAPAFVLRVGEAGDVGGCCMVALAEASGLCGDEEHAPNTPNDMTHAPTARSRIMRQL